MIDNIRDAVKIVQKMDNMELYRDLLDLQAEALELTQKLKEKDGKIAQLEEALKIKGKMVLRRMAYYITDENGGKFIDGPFCTKCFDVDHVMCRIVLVEGMNAVKCQKCKIKFQDYNIIFDFPKTIKT